MKKIIVFCLALLVLSACVVVMNGYKKEDIISVIKSITRETTKEENTEENTSEKSTKEENTETNLKMQNEEIYAVWLTYSEIGSLVKGKSENEYRESLETVFTNLKNNKINTVFYQCRAFCDSFYTSEIFPVSKYITAESQILTFDPFETFLEKARVNGISVHCWVNPYRISYEVEFENLPENSPARKLYKENKNALIICDKGIFLNPATDEARELVLKGIREIMGKYKVDGIHFDDYFYPETEKINDGKIYKKYKNQGGTLSLKDWRRENVNVLISSVYSLLKAQDEDLIFSVSPSADVEKCRNVFYADVEKWCREEGFIDLIIPQIYYGFENESMPFTYVMKSWGTFVEESDVVLVCGLAPYKCGRTDEFAGKGKNEWNENVNILSRQYEQVKKTRMYQGFSLFSYSYCFGDNVTEISKKEIKNLLYMVE